MAARKTAHWMWFVFPQIEGLSRSAKGEAYAIRSFAEARAYAADPDLGGWLRRCTMHMLSHDGIAAETILGAVDAQKLRSSLTLFAAADPEGPYAKALSAFYDAPCPVTARWLTATSEETRTR